MDQHLQLFKSIINDKEDVDIGIKKITCYIDTLKQDKTRYTPLLRALTTLRCESYFDFTGHLRQVSTYFRCDFEISNKLYKKIKDYSSIFNFIYEDGKISFSPSFLDNYSELKTVYNFEYKRKNKATISDGELFKNFKFDTYKSLSQKLLTYFVNNTVDNEVILASLPTGGGKSMIWQLPAVSNRLLGTIIVVVPTVALAIDHEKSSNQIFDNADYQGLYPVAYYSDLSNSEKDEIFKNLESGMLPILYISPEALLSKSFYSKVISVAEKGLISALFIDEAHLIVGWGQSFRPEFQMLSVLKKNIERVTCEKFFTVLLSATLTDRDIKVIRTIFDSKNFTEFHADELRCEPSFYIRECDSEDERKRIILEILSNAPKPIILYTITPELCEEYVKFIKEYGFFRVASFTGKTNNKDRKTILNMWNNNEVDIIVATSAFGMGVDKSDVRTIITAYIPESINRFYQEVGRAGRDGYSTLNYLIIHNEVDSSYVSNLTKSLVMKSESIVSRWKVLLEKSKYLTPTTKELDINIPPEHLMYTYTGKKNASWNKDTIMFLYRTGLIDIIEVSNDGYYNYKIQIELKNIEVLENIDNLECFIEDYRQNERDRITEGIQNMKQLIKQRSKSCISRLLVDEFSYSNYVCSGCPYCRQNNQNDYFEPPSIEVLSSKNTLFINESGLNNNRLSQTMKLSDKIHIYYENILNEEEIILVIEKLVASKVNVIVCNFEFNKTDLLKKLAFYDGNNYIILKIDELKNINHEWLNGNIALFLESESHVIGEIYDRFSNYCEKDGKNKLILLANEKYYINSQNKLLSELVDRSIDIKNI